DLFVKDRSWNTEDKRVLVYIPQKDSPSRDHPTPSPVAILTLIGFRRADLSALRARGRRCGPLVADLRQLFHSEDDRLAGKRVLLGGGASLHLSGNDDRLLDRPGIRQRDQGKAAATLVLIQEHAVQSDVGHQHSGRQVQ